MLPAIDELSAREVAILRSRMHYLATHSGTRISDVELGTSWIYWKVFRRADLEAVFDLRDPNMPRDLTFDEPHEPTVAGSSFAKRPYVRIGRSRVLITQSAGYDV